LASVLSSLKETKWWKVLPDGALMCTLCPRYCRFPTEKTVGGCGVRIRLDGKIQLGIYGKTTGWALDPIEKKPMFHFYPGSCAFSIGTIGCNLFCRFCQNWVISQSRISAKSLKFPLRLDDLPPETAVKYAKENGCTSIAYTYNEPIVWYEYMYDTAKLAHKEGIKNVMVSNGYINEDPLKELAPYIDGANIDLKGDETFYRKLTGTLKAPETILNTIKILKEKGTMVEITILIIPKWNDSEDFFKWIGKWVLDNFGPEGLPVHLSRFYPNYKLRSLPPTPVRTIEKARGILMELGLKYVYVGNVPGHPGEHTYCPNCGKPVIKRDGFIITEYNLTDDNKCKFCGYKISIRGNYRMERSWVYFHIF